MKIKIADIVEMRYEDGPGLRTTIFFQGCSIKCKECHNEDIWDIKNGKDYTITTLIEEIEQLSSNVKKVTISGGEPMNQKKELIELIEKLYEKNFEIALYTSYDLKEIPIEILKKIRYLKIGKYDKDLKIKGNYYGSSNQKFYELEEGKIINER